MNQVTSQTCNSSSELTIFKLRVDMTRLTYRNIYNVNNSSCLVAIRTKYVKLLPTLISKDICLLKLKFQSISRL